MDEMDGHVVRMRDEECVKIVGKPEGKRLLGRIRHRWETNVKTNLNEMGMRIWT
jgi:hypothetical protein